MRMYKINAVFVLAAAGLVVLLAVTPGAAQNRAHAAGPAAAAPVAGAVLRPLIRPMARGGRQLLRGGNCSRAGNSGTANSTPQFCR